MGINVTFECPLCETKVPKEAVKCPKCNAKFEPVTEKDITESKEKVVKQIETQKVKAKEAEDAKKSVGETPARVEKPKTDHRENTWKIYRSKEDWKKLDKWIHIKKDKYPMKKGKDLVRKLAKDVLSDLMENEKSFGIVKPKTVRFT